MKKILLSLFLLTLVLPTFATHLIGGEMRYEYIGPGSQQNSKQYRIRLLLLRGPGGATFINQYIVGVFNNDNGQKVLGTADNQNWAAVQDFVTPIPVPINVSPCIQNAPNLQYTYKTYSFVIELPDNNTGYTVAFQTFSRQNSQNILNDQGATYSCVIPGQNLLPNPMTDNSPQFSLPVNVICANSDFSLDFSATDVDGDSLVYSFCEAFNGGPANQADFRNPVAPPYGSVNYVNPFNPGNPLGPQATIDPNTGIISGIAPNAGKYVVAVCVAFYKNGVLRGVHRKDLIVEVSPCIPTNADPMPDFITCDGFNVQFFHSSTGAQSVFWDFGYPGIDNDTSNLDSPVFVYPDTGVFTVKLIINKGGNCTDSSELTIRVFPGFFPGFVTNEPYCVGQPITFTDTTLTHYGVVNSWSWNFGDGTTLADTSHLEIPSYTYNTPGTYTISLDVGNSKGCQKSITKQITVHPTPVTQILPGDTTYCGLDSLQLTASGSGNFSWFPATNINGANTPNPEVFPTTATEYIVELEANGCRGRDSVTVTPLFNLANAITASPASICEGDTLTLSGSANQAAGVTWQWNNGSTLSGTGQQVVSAFPIATTTYTLTTTWGENCVATSSQTINVTPLATPNAGPDTTFCTGQGGVTLQASGGNTYQWSPSTGLSNASIPNPVATPASTTQYIVSVGVTGCSRLRNDTLIVEVRPKPDVTMPNDTLICVIDTLSLMPAAQGNFAWSPAYNISSTTVQNPDVSPDVPTMYYLTVTDQYGCFRMDSVFVDVKADVSINAGNDTTICQTDSFILGATSDGLTFTWSPSDGLSDPNVLNPVATPETTTDYIVTANIGNCERNSSVRVAVVPYPDAYAGEDVPVCIGASTRLQATGGTSYSWEPTMFLSDPNVSNPVVNQPSQTMQYVVTVTDNLGCPKPVKDTIVVTVIPQLNVNAGPADTTIVEGQPLYLNATGALNYVWTPDIALSNAFIPNPLSTTESNIVYTVTGTDAYGCRGTDSINVIVYRLDADMYVPTAFTPNNDGLNDDIKPILLGMRSLNYFRVYNRFGQLVFSTSEIGKGWNGIYLGKPQDTGTFVWYAEGVTFKGEVRKQKGYVILIR